MQHIISSFLGKMSSLIADLPLKQFYQFIPQSLCHIPPMTMTFCSNDIAVFTQFRATDLSKCAIRFTINFFLTRIVSYKPEMDI